MRPQPLIRPDRQNFNTLQSEWQKYVAMKDALLVVSRKNDTSGARPS